jgi:hypothetical protein
MMKKLAAIAMLALCASGLSGCFSLIDMEHNLNQLRVWNNGLSDAHRSLDRFVFDYDWDDPSSSIGYETPNTR